MWPFSFCITCSFFSLVHCSTTTGDIFLLKYCCHFTRLYHGVITKNTTVWRMQKCTISVCHRSENFFYCKMGYTYCSSSHDVLSNNCRYLKGSVEVVFFLIVERCSWVPSLGNSGLPVWDAANEVAPVSSSCSALQWRDLQLPEGERKITYPFKTAGKIIILLGWKRKMQTFLKFWMHHILSKICFVLFFVATYFCLAMLRNIQEEGKSVSCLQSAIIPDAV